MMKNILGASTASQNESSCSRIKSNLKGCDEGGPLREGKGDQSIEMGIGGWQRCLEELTLYSSVQQGLKYTV